VKAAKAKSAESKAAKEKLAWSAVSCAAACRDALNTRIHLAATCDAVRDSIGSSAAADIPDFVTVDLCGRSAVTEARHPASAGQ